MSAAPKKNKPAEPAPTPLNASGMVDVPPRYPLRLSAKHSRIIQRLALPNERAWDQQMIGPDLPRCLMKQVSVELRTLYFALTSPMGLDRETADAVFALSERCQGLGELALEVLEGNIEFAHPDEVEKVCRDLA